MSRSIDPMAQHKAGCGLSRRTPRPHRFDESAAGYSLAGCSPAEPASASPANLIMPPLGWIRYAFSVNCNPSLISWPRRRGPVHSPRTPRTPRVRIRALSLELRGSRRGPRTKTVSLDGVEFLRRFLLPVLPRGFVRIRSFGLLAHRHRSAALAKCRQLLADSSIPTPLPRCSATNSNGPSSGVALAATAACCESSHGSRPRSCFSVHPICFPWLPSTPPETQPPLLTAQGTFCSVSTTRSNIQSR